MSEKKEVFKQVEGCRNIHIAKRNDLTGIYGVPIHIRGLSEIKTTDQYKEGVSYGDMKKMLYKKKKSGMDVSIVANELPPQNEALLMGKSYFKGELVSNVDDQSSEVAILWEEVWSDGTSSYNIIYRNTLSREGREGKGNSENIDYQTISLSGSALPLENGDFDMVLFADDPDADKNKIENFFKQVQMPGKTVNNNEIASDECIEVEYKEYSTGAISGISIEGVTFNLDSKKFLKVPKNTTKFTFKLDEVAKTATLSSGTWKFS
ncbi:hypothetical protein FC959_17180 [Clostridium botulinum]|uniref:major tail protein n=1 Tax=Clostridium cagae TaxID=2080751 RepID=UPI0038463554|nr:hypothetical protein [Clostridium botulinum]